MATKNNKAESDVEETLKFPTAEEAKWGSVNFRTSLWQYFFQIKKGKPLTAADIKVVEKTFRQIQEVNWTLFKEVEVEGKEKKSKAASLLDEVGDEVNSLLNAKTLPKLKLAWTAILDGRYESLNRKQKKYLNDIKDKRKGELLK